MRRLGCQTRILLFWKHRLQSRLGSRGWLSIGILTWCTVSGGVACGGDHSAPRSGSADATAGDADAGSTVTAEAGMGWRTRH